MLLLLVLSEPKEIVLDGFSTQSPFALTKTLTRSLEELQSMHCSPFFSGTVNSFLQVLTSDYFLLKISFFKAVPVNWSEDSLVNVVLCAAVHVAVTPCCVIQD